MRLSVPKHRPGSWQLDLGLASQLISPDGELTRINVWQRRAVLALAYAVKIALLNGATPSGGERLFTRRQRRVMDEGRRISVRLGDLDVFAPAGSLDLSVHEGFDRFAAAVPRPRVRELISWAPPFVAHDARTGRTRVYANQLITGLARHLAPDLVVSARRYGRRPVHQLNFQEIGSLMLCVFGDFIDRNTELVCRLSGTSAEAALLIGKSLNTAAQVRKRWGVLKL
jgi:hypothetical protein